MKRCLVLLFLFLASCASTPSVPPATLAAEYYNLGNVYYELKKYKEAGEYYQKALLYDQDNPQALYNLALALAQQGKTTEALGSLSGLAARDPENWLLVKTMAYLKYLQGDKSGALDDYERTLSAGAGDLDTRRAAAYLAQELEKTEQALGHFELYRKDGGTDGKTLAAYGRLLLKGPRASDGAEVLGGLGAVLEEDGDITLDLIQYRVSQKEYDQALSLYPKLEVADKKNSTKRPQVWFEAGALAATAIQDMVKAKEFFQRSIDQGFSDREAVKALLEREDLFRPGDFVSFFTEAKLYGEVSDAAKK